MQINNATILIAIVFGNQVNDLIESKFNVSKISIQMKLELGLSAASQFEYSGLMSPNAMLSSKVMK